MADLPCDTLAAVFLFKDLVGSRMRTRPLVLKSHVYSVVDSHTTADRELDQLRLSRKLRVMKVAPDLDEFAVMLWADYVDTVNDAIAARLPAGNGASAATAAVPVPAGSPATRSASPATAASPQGGRGTLILLHFRDVVLPNCLELVVTTGTLDRLLTQQPVDQLLTRQPVGPAETRSTRPGGSMGRQLTGPVTRDDYTKHLLAAGFLCRDHTRGDAFMFCVPQQGALLQQMRGGRQELLGWMGKRRYKEAKETEVLKLKLRASRLGVAFHIKDLLGVGAVKALRTTSGTVYKVAYDKGRG